MQVNFRHDPNTEVQRTRKINLAFSSLSLHTSLGLGQRNAGNENVFGFWGLEHVFHPFILDWLKIWRRYCLLSLPIKCLLYPPLFSSVLLWILICACNTFIISSNSLMSLPTRITVRVFANRKDGGDGLGCLLTRRRRARSSGTSGAQ